MPKNTSMSSSYLSCSVFITILGLVVPSESLQGLFQNPGQGVNFYGKIQSNPPVSKTKAKKAYDDLMHPDCKLPSNGSNCKTDIFYHYPGIMCQIEDPLPCDYSYPYRTYDGSCNNPHASRFGMSGQCYERFLPPFYDGYGDFRKSVTGGPLPEPRELSLKIFKDIHHPTVNVSFQFVEFAEFTILDVLQTLKTPLDCCSEKDIDDPSCISIKLKPDDPFFSQFNRTCIPMPRAKDCSCKSLKRSQQNGASAHMDDSQLYGSHKEGAMKARTLDGTGQLKHDVTNVGCLLPRGKNPNDPFCPKGYDSVCFKGADPRINHHTIVMSHFTIFMREHNRLATELKKINPHWGDEKLFQEARKILNGEHQCMFFRDFLPLLLTPRIMDAFNLTVPEGENGIEYNSSVIPGTWNEFAICSFRLHSMVRKEIGSLNLRFKQTFLNPLLIREGHMTQIISGIRQIPAEQYDRYMIEDFTDYLYEEPGVPYGQDLASFNIKRGRDHGLAPYVEVVKYCSEGTLLISSFDDLFKFGLMSKSNTNLLKRVYAAVEDIDMFVGMNLEEHMPGSPLSSSSICINAKQFYFIQKGDRFYFDIVGPDAPFTTEQRKAIKQSSWARILCDNTHITEVTKNPFLLPSDENTNVPCSEIPKIDLTLWKDEGNDTIHSPKS